MTKYPVLGQTQQQLRIQKKPIYIQVLNEQQEMVERKVQL